ncbi:molybdopterin-dependent oxidoreductase [Mangrovihabitans endophyticus]|uniref:Molybdopterin-binding protein n=1 Tax=Mangrovihabitans endophyticus TaxID=1751298 RepID=A0A8J3FND1_9ACTN|nr:molybdopterin-dependent oxidoreductase [Mangrovihabitans endophyticus]GGK80589.1 molybdopterin-binding protein [Mangrovihabitans endophyticus]
MVRDAGTSVTGRARAAVAWLQAPPDTLRRGPFRPGAFGSALRSTRLTSQLGVALGIAFAICFLTGVTSHLIQHPPGWFWWPSRPVSLYRVTQGLHVATGLAMIPLLGAKLWSVYPRLFSWPPVPGPARAIELLGIVALVGGGLFQVVSGVLNINRWYAPMPFFFTAAHYWVAWLTIGGLLAHIGVQLPVVREALRRTPPETPAPAPAKSANDGLVADRPDAGGSDAGGSDAGGPDAGGPDAGGPDAGGPDGPVATRRRLLGAVGAAAGVITVATVGQTVAPLSGISLLAPRRPDTGPQGLPVNKSAAGARVRRAALDPGYRLRISGPRPVALSLADLAALPQHTATLPITCVEGWSASATWSGVRLRDLAKMAGVDPEHAVAEVESLEAAGRYRTSSVAAPHLRDPLTLIALRLDGSDLHLDHGYPARLIAPNRPGVMQTKWLSRITLRSMS